MFLYFLYFFKTLNATVLKVPNIQAIFTISLFFSFAFLDRQLCMEYSAVTSVLSGKGLGRYC